MQLFALVQGAGMRVHRVPLGQKLQKEVAEIFRLQATAFLQNADLIPFAASYNPEIDEVLEITDFDDPDKLSDAGANPLACPILKITDESLEKLIGLFVITIVDGKKSVCLQYFDRRRALTKKKFTLLSIGDGLEKLEQSGLILDNTIAVVLQDNRLLFRSYHIASRFFDLTSYFHEATDKELTAFAEHPSFVTPDIPAFQEVANTSRMRKQIALILASEIMDEHSPKKIVRRAAQFKLKIKTVQDGKNTKLVLPIERAALKSVLDFLQENYYKGCLTATTYVSNSKRPAAV